MAGSFGEVYCCVEGWKSHTSEQGKIVDKLLKRQEQWSKWTERVVGEDGEFFQKGGGKVGCVLHLV